MPEEVFQVGESFRVITCLVCAPSVRAPCINRKLTTVKAKAKRMLSLKCDADAEQFVATADLSTFDLLSGFSGIMYLTPHERGGVDNERRQAGNSASARRRARSLLLEPGGAACSIGGHCSEARA